MAAALNRQDLEQEPPHDVAECVKRFIETECESVKDQGLPKYDGITEWLEKCYDTPASQDLFAAALMDLDVKVTSALGPGSGVEADSAYTMVVPPPSGGRGSKAVKDIPLRIWQLGFGRQASAKGPSMGCDIKDAITRGNEKEDMNTSTYNVEVLFTQCGLEDGDNIENFKVGVSIGFGVVTACFCVCRWAVDTQVFTTDYERFVKNPPFLRTCLRLWGLYMPAKNKTEQSFQSISTKMAASGRQRPNILQILDSFAGALAEASAQNPRKTKTEHVKLVVERYNQGEKVRRCKIFADELSGLKFLAKRSNMFQKLLRWIWGSENRPDCSPSEPIGFPVPDREIRHPSS